MFQNCNKKDQFSSFHKILSMEASNNKSNWRQHGVQSVWWTVTHRCKNYDKKLVRKNLWFIEENHWSCRHAAGRAEDGKRAKYQWQVLYIWRMIDQSLKTTNFQWFSFEKTEFWIKVINPQKWSNCVIR